ncbi:MAG: glycoside hydrolase family 38 C-terminal domain-containing protein [Tepidisphaerales bacterium]
MKHTFAIIVLFAAAYAGPAAAGEAGFTRLAPTDRPKVIAAAPAFPGGAYEADNILSEPTAQGLRRDYASQGQGTKTFVDFDLGRSLTVAAFRHVQRATVDTVVSADLIFSDQPDFKVALATVHVQHEDRPGATTFAAFTPVKARYVRWQVTAASEKSPKNVGGNSVAFYEAAGTDPVPSRIAISASTLPIIRRDGDRRVQTLKVILDSPYLQAIEVTVRVPAQDARPVKLSYGKRTVEFAIPAIESEQSMTIAVDLAGQAVAQGQFKLAVPPHHTIYILPHSHTDIGYTEIQTEIEDKQVNNLLLGIEYAKRTANYPPGARFVWNVEVLWAADLYLHRLGPAQQQAFLDAVKNGQVALNGMYLNELTGLCRPEELMRLFTFATQLRRQTGATIDSAMISDVPGYTWGTVTAMSQAGIRYFSVAPNYFDRIGDILVQWENKPFWWVGPSGKDQVLVWIPYKGYAMSHIYSKLTPEFVGHYLDQLQRTNYPYEIAYMRWAGHGDNALPDPAICEFVKDWSASHEWPKFVIASTGEAFRAFEKRYGDQIPRIRGDWTPYWEDGAGSSALETGMNRGSSDRLIQSEALWAMSRPVTYPAADFEAAWRDVLLYSEHTWGAWCSIGDPARRETREQWAIKQSYAAAADRNSRTLLSRALAIGRESADRDGAIDVLNTTSWPRTDLVIVPKSLCEHRDRVLDDQGKPVPSQRLRSGELAFVADNVGPLAARRYTIQEGKALSQGPAIARGNVLKNDLVELRIDEKTGAIAELRAKGLDANLAGSTSGHAINDYLYLVGDNLADLQRSGPVKIVVQDPGPLVASVQIECDAPGCYKLRREVRVVAGLDRAELTNIVDKQRLQAADYNAKTGKESVNFAFPFNVPGGQMRFDVPFGVVRPEADQIPSACKNWLTVGRWADVSNDDLGVTWVTLDAPLIQIGGITATLVGSQTNPDVWRKQIDSTQSLYSWAMNNHWGTNYRAYQEGPVAFRFALRPHAKLDLAAASRFATGLSQPLIATAARGAAPAASRLQLDSADVLVTSLKPSNDGKAIIVRLWGGAGRDAHTALTWSAPAPKRIWLSDLGERPLKELTGPVTVPAWGVVTLRADLDE